MIPQDDPTYSTVLLYIHGLEPMTFTNIPESIIMAVVSALRQGKGKVE